MNLLFYLLNLIQEEFDKMDSRPLFFGVICQTEVHEIYQDGSLKPLIHPSSTRSRIKKTKGIPFPWPIFNLLPMI